MYLRDIHEDFPEELAKDRGWVLDMGTTIPRVSVLTWIKRERWGWVSAEIPFSLFHDQSWASWHTAPLPCLTHHDGSHPKTGSQLSASPKKLLLAHMTRSNTHCSSINSSLGKRIQKSACREPERWLMSQTQAMQARDLSSDPSTHRNAK